MLNKFFKIKNKDKPSPEQKEKSKEPKSKSKAELQWESLSPAEQGEVYWMYMVRESLKNKAVWDDPKIKENVLRIIGDGYDKEKERGKEGRNPGV